MSTWTNDELVRFADVSKVADDSLKSFLKTWDGTGNIAEEYQKHLKNSSTVTSEFGTALKSMAANMVISLIIVGISKLVSMIAESIPTFEKATEALTNASSEYESVQSELQSLQSELDETSDRLKELQDLADSGAITLAEEAELETLKQQNAELERKVALKQKEADIAAGKESEAADDVLGFSQAVDDITQTTGAANSKMHAGELTTTTYQKTTVLEATKNELAELEKIKNERKELLDGYTDDDEETLAELDGKVAEYEEAIQENISTITNARNGYLDADGNVKKDLSSKQYENYKEATKLLDEWVNIDLSPTQKDLKAIESYFDGSVSKNVIKDKFKDAVESGDSLNNVLDEIGISLDDIGVDNIDNLVRYFDELSTSTDEAKKSVKDYAQTVEDIEAAFESDNKDNDWSTISEKYKEATELLKEGKTGTDDFQSVAGFLNPELVKKYADKNGKYTADAYQKAFESVKNTASRWFGEDETKSMKNFVNDFQKKGLFGVKTDADGLWDIEAKFETSAQAANEFGMSVESVETMLRALEAYGYGEVIGDIKFSSESLQEYNTYLSQIQEAIDSTDDKELQVKLQAILDEESKTDYEEQIDDLTPAKIQEIKVIADLSQYDAEISKLEYIQKNNGFNDTGENAVILGTYEGRNEYAYDSLKSSKQDKLKRNKGWNTLLSAENQLTNNITNADSEEALKKAQSQKLALENLKAEYLDIFKDSNISWDEFLKTDDAESALDKITELYGVSVDDIETLLDKDLSFNVDTETEVEDKEVEITARDDVTSVLDEIARTTGYLTDDEHVIDMITDDKSSPELINVLSLMSGVDEGTLTEMNASDGASATITYVLSRISGIPEETITQMFATDENATDTAKLVKDSVDGVPLAPDVKFGATITDNFKNAISNALTRLRNYASKANAITSGVRITNGGGQLTGTAHASGSLGIRSSIPYNVLNDEKYKTKGGQVALTGELGRRYCDNT